MIACLSFLELEYKGGFFQMQNVDKVILGVGLFLSIDCISSIDLKEVTFWGELKLWHYEIA